MYNITQAINGSDTLPNLLGSINILTNGFFILMTLLILWIILFIAFKTYETRVGLLASSMIIELLCILCWWAGWITFTYVFFPLVFVFVALLWFALAEG